MGGRPTIRRLFKPMQDRFTHPVKIADDICIADMQHRKTKPVQCRIAFEVRQNIMCVAIHFDYQTLLRTKEIGDERADNCLAAEFMTAELGPGQASP